MAPASPVREWTPKRYIHKLERKSQPLMPYLPEQRPRPLTPTSFHYEFSRRNWFFDVLPFEIRRKILCEAFGNETVHMELDYDHPMIPLELPTEKHGARNSILCRDTSRRSQRLFTGPKNRLRTNDRQAKKWQWWSCVCHQRTTVFSGVTMFTEEEPWMDGCKLGINEWCRTCPGNAPAKCQIGIMGWLLSCRQA